MFKALFYIECVPAGLKAGQMDAEEMTCTSPLPFVPHPGMSLSVTKEGDFLTVQDVYWKKDEPDVVEIFFQADMRHDVDYYMRQGWELVGKSR